MKKIISRKNARGRYDTRIRVYVGCVGTLTGAIDIILRAAARPAGRTRKTLNPRDKAEL